MTYGIFKSFFIYVARNRLNAWFDTFYSIILKKVRPRMLHGNGVHSPLLHRRKLLKRVFLKNSLKPRVAQASHKVSVCFTSFF